MSRNKEAELRPKNGHTFNVALVLRISGCPAQKEVRPALARRSRPGYASGHADVTRLLPAAEAGDPHAAAELLPLVYAELRRLAAARMATEKAGHTLQPTVLVHEAYLRLVGRGRPQDWSGRGHFFAAAAEAMRRILVEGRPQAARRRSLSLDLHRRSSGWYASARSRQVIWLRVLSQFMSDGAQLSRRPRKEGRRGCGRRPQEAAPLAGG